MIYQLCVNSIGINTLKNNLNTVVAQIDAMCSDYLTKGASGDLFLIAPDTNPSTSAYLGVATKADFKNIYTQQMVGVDKPGRIIYDLLLASAPKGKCPLCGFAQATTLDHYLAKSPFPQFSVFPSNLVPACAPCNFKKRAGIATVKTEQTIHPYFDFELVSEQWLYASVVPGSPLTIRYFADPPVMWTADNKARVESHFKLLGLQEKFSTEAVDELASIRDTILQYSANKGAAHIQKDLLQTAQDRYEIHKNSWQTALFQALANSLWYCQGGFHHVA